MQALQGGRVLHPSPCQLLMTAGYPRPYTLASRAAMPLLLNLCWLAQFCWRHGITFAFHNLHVLLFTTLSLTSIVLEGDCAFDVDSSVTRHDWNVSFQKRVLHEIGGCVQVYTIRWSCLSCAEHSLVVWSYLDPLLRRRLSRHVRQQPHSPTQGHLEVGTQHLGYSRRSPESVHGVEFLPRKAFNQSWPPRSVPLLFIVPNKQTNWRWQKC